MWVSLGGGNVLSNAVLTFVTDSHAGILVVAFAAYNLNTWFRAPFRVLSPPIRRSCFTSRSLIPSIKAWATYLCMKNEVNGRLSKGLVRQPLDSSCVLLVSHRSAGPWPSVETGRPPSSWWSPERPFSAPTMFLNVCLAGTLCRMSTAWPSRTLIRCAAFSHGARSLCLAASSWQCNTMQDVGGQFKK